MKGAILTTFMAVPAMLLASSGPAIPADQRPADRAHASVSAREDLVEYVVRPGDTAQSIVARGFRDPADWEQWNDVEAEENDRTPRDGTGGGLG